MHANLQKNIDTELISQEQAEHIQKAIENGESIIVSGHRSMGTRVLMVQLIQVAMQDTDFDVAQISSADDVEAKDAKFYAYPKPGEDVEEVVQAIFNKKGASMISMKDDEIVYSINKILKKGFKESEDTERAVNMLILTKIPLNQDGKPLMEKIQRLTFNEKGKIQREELVRDLSAYEE